MNQVEELLLRRRRVLVAEEGPATEQSRAIFLAHLFQLGFVVENPEAYTDRMLEGYQDLIELLTELRGSHTHVPLYSNFPDEVPEPDDYFLKRLLGYVIAQSRWDVPGRKLSSGVTVPEWLFELEIFGADPITQRQDLGLFLKQKFQQMARLNEQPRRPTSLRIIPASDALRTLEDWVRWCLTSQTSFPEFYRQEILLALDSLPDFVLTAKEVAFREHRALYAAYLWSAERWPDLHRFCSTPTDLLRLLVQLAGGDVSLAEPVRFPPLNRAERRAVLGMLNGMKGPVVEDQLLKYRGLWLALERSLHSGEYRKLFPHACRLFRRLKKGELKRKFRELELAYERGDEAAVLRELAHQPGGVSLRRFCQTLALTADASTLKPLMSRVSRAALKDQLTLYCVLRRDREATEALVLTKRGSSQVIPRSPERLSRELREEAIRALQTSIAETVVGRFGPDSWIGKKVYIDPLLANYTVPTGLRSASDSLTVLGRGSRVKLGSQSTLRFFVYWKQNFRTTDVDLSAVTLNESFEITGQVSWTNLKGLGMLHSGDLQSAPFGAAEFIDLKIDTLLESGQRYLGMVLFRYCGEYFSEMECFAGWMMREHPSSNYKTFDIATVEQKLLVGGEVTCALPAVFDLKEREVHWLDLRFYGNDNFSHVESSDKKIERAVRLGVGMSRWKLSLAELAELHQVARGGSRALERSDADIVFSADSGGDFHPGNWSRILSELL